MNSLLQNKELFGLLSLVLVLVCFIPYIITILQNKTRPHIFSWLIWGTLEAIACAAQISDHGGPGAWSAGVTAIFSFATVLLALRHGEKNITLSDKICFGGALLAIPVWLLTKNPLGAVILISLIDMLGFIPTYRKAFHRPDQKMLTIFLISIFKCAFSLIALTHISAITVIYPASLIVTNSIFVTMTFTRRQMLKKEATT